MRVTRRFGAMSCPYLPHQKVAEPFYATRPYQNIEGRRTTEVCHHEPLDIRFGDSNALDYKREDNNERDNTYVCSVSSRPPATFSCTADRTAVAISSLDV